MRTSILTKPFLLVALAAASVSVNASTVDITMDANSQGQLEVKLRPSANFDGLVSSLVFTVRWDAGTEAHLGNIHQVAPASTYMPVSRSGAEQDDAGNRYQIFVGFGMTPMQWIPTDWVAGQEYTICTIDVSGAAAFSLVNDTWTGLNNADYYLALGTTTGIVAGTMGGNGLSVVPNPTNKATLITLDLKTAQDLRLELLNAAGQVVWKEDRPNASGNVRVPLDMATLDKGVYLLRIHAANQVMTERVVKR
jgi:hypothetical protein